MIEELLYPELGKMKKNNLKNLMVLLKLISVN